MALSWGRHPRAPPPRSLRGLETTPSLSSSSVLATCFPINTISDSSVTFSTNTKSSHLLSQSHFYSPASPSRSLYPSSLASSSSSSSLSVSSSKGHHAAVSLQTPSLREFCATHQARRLKKQQEEQEQRLQQSKQGLDRLKTQSNGCKERLIDSHKLQIAMMEKIEAAIKMREQLALKALQEEIAFEAEKVCVWVYVFCVYLIRICICICVCKYERMCMCTRA
jgi:hypothetical protein